MRIDERDRSADRSRSGVFGLSHLGCVSAACMAARGDVVLDVDAGPRASEFVHAGRAPIVEERIGEVVACGRLQGRDAAAAVHESEMPTDDAGEALAHAAICVVGPVDTKVVAALERIDDRHFVGDLAQVPKAAQRRADPYYAGIAW